MTDKKEINKMELRAATRRSGFNTTQRVDPESDGTDSSDEIVFTCLPDRESLTEGEIKINEISRVQQAARRKETTRKTAARHANIKQCKTRKNKIIAENTSVESADSETRRTKIARAMREARRLETPEQTAERRAKANEGQRKRRELYRAVMERAKHEAELSRETKTLSTSPLCTLEADVNVTWSIKQDMKRIEKLRELREARNKETPEQAAARRAKAAEVQRKRRERLREERKTETPEATAARLAKEAELAKRITPEQAAARRAKRAGYERKRRQRKALKEGKKIKGKKKHVAKEIPEQFAARRKRATELQRNSRAQLRAEREQVTSDLTTAPLVKKRTETPEEAATRRAKAAAYERQRRQQKTLKRLQERAKATEREKLRRKLRAETETPEQAAARRQKAAESQRMRRDLLRHEMPERIAAFRAKAAAYERQRRQRKACCREKLNAAEREKIRRANETPEQTAARRAKAAAAQRMKREQLKAAGETPEQTAVRHAKEDERRKRKEMRLARGERDPLNSTMSAEDDFYRLERLRLLREARKRETPEEAAARRAKANKSQRRRREQLRAMRKAETSKQTAARIAKKAELREAESPQEEDVRLAKRSEYKKKRKQVHAVAETPEKATIRRAKAAARERKRRLDNSFAYANAIERQRQKRKLLKETETPEQAAGRRAKAAANQRKRREQMRAAREAHAPPFEWLHGNVTAAEKERRRRQLRAATETPEQAAERRAKAAEREKQRRQRKAFACLQDSTLSAKCQRERIERKHEAKKKGTSEQVAARRERAALGQRKRREQMRAVREALNCSKSSSSNVSKGRPRTRFQKATAENTSSQQNYTDEELHSSSTRSAFERPEGSSSLISIDDHSTVLQSLVETSIAITEYEEDPWLCFDNSELSIVSENIFNETEVFESFADVAQDLVLKSIESNNHTGGDDPMDIATNLAWFSKLLDANKGRDEHLVYCEYIAERFRKCNRGITEIEVAKNIIEGIMFNLSTGAYKSLSSAFQNKVGQEEEAPTIRPPIIEPVIQAIILKEEVQL